jgi:hypothetical protein
MCGLVAVINKYRNGFVNEQAEAFDLLLWVDTFRGDDSTGVFMVNNIGNVKLAKEATYAPRFMSYKEYGDLRRDAIKDGWVMVGHNRKATRGQINDENAHPFVVDNNIVLVHNGSYNGEHKGLKDVEVDSLAIAHTISEEKDVEKALRKVNAAYALIWYNQDDKALNVIRNNARPLWIMEMDNSFVLASEEAFLQLVKHKAYKGNFNKDVKPRELKEYELTTFTLQDDKSTKVETRELDCSYYKHLAPIKEGPFRSQYDAAEEATREYWAGLMAGANNPECGVEPPPAHVSSPLPVAIVDSRKVGLHAVMGNRKTVPTPLTASKVDTTTPAVTNKILELLYPGMQTLAFKEFSTINSELKTGTKIKVIINNLTEATDDPKSEEFVLVGQTIDNSKMYAAFPVQEKEFSKAVASTNDSIFEMEIDRVAWRCTEPEDVKQKNKKPMPDWQGVVIVHGKNPVPIYTTEQSNATH